MKVLLLSPMKDYSNHRLAKHIYDYLGVRTNFNAYLLEPLRKIADDVIPFDYTERMVEVGQTAMNQEIIAIAEREKPDYVLWLRSYYEIFNETFTALRKGGAIVIGWFGDDEVCFEDYSEWRIPYMDYCVTGDVHSLIKYLQSLCEYCGKPLVGCGIERITEGEFLEFDGKDLIPISPLEKKTLCGNCWEKIEVQEGRILNRLWKVKGWGNEETRSAMPGGNVAG